MAYSSRKNAFILVVAIFFVVVFASVGVIAVSMLSTGSFSALRDLNGNKALNIAEGGIRFTIAASLISSSDWTTAAAYSKNIGGGSFSVTYPQTAKNQVTIKSQGTINGITRTVQAIVTRPTSTSPKDFGYGMFAGNQGGGPLIVQNSAKVDGDFYYNGDVIMKNSSTLVNGTLISKSLTLQNFATCASWEPLPVPPIAPPSFEPTYYNNLLNETTKSASSALNLSNSSVLNLNGQTLYYTSITISGSARINGPGTLVSKGNFTAQNSSIIGDQIRIIAAGDTMFSNSVQVGNSVEVISADDVSISNGQNFPFNNLIYSKEDVLFNNSSFFYGSILAPYGDMTSVNATKFRGLIYAYGIDLQNSTNLRGSVIVDNVGYFSNSAVVTYDPSVLPSNWPEGLSGVLFSGTPTTSNWREIY